MTTPLVERLRRIAVESGVPPYRSPIHEAADRITTLESQVAALREALEPFANIATRIRETATDERWLEAVLFYAGDDEDPTKWSLTGRAFDRARAAVEAIKADARTTLSRERQEGGRVQCRVSR